MTLVKICGLKQNSDIEYVNTLLPDYVGFVFVENSRRYITPKKAAELKKRLDNRIKVVGVFVDAQLEFVAELASQGIIDIIHLQGKESNSYIRNLRKLKGVLKYSINRSSNPQSLPVNCLASMSASGFISQDSMPIIKAFSISSKQDVIHAMESQADMILLDNGVGGTGETFDWSHVSTINRPFILAGGLTVENVSEAIKVCKPFGIDTSTGVEIEGRKAFDKIQEFIAIVRGEKGESMEQKKGRFGAHGGQFIPETLMNTVIELEKAYEHYKNDADFRNELSELFNEYAGRPSRLYFANKMTQDLGGAKIYLKREDLNHTGSHKINNVLGQALLAKRMEKTRLIAETGAGQHGVATATAAALMGMECVIFMGKEDTERQALNVYRMRLLGAEVISVTTGTARLKDAVSEAMREWSNRIDDTHYCLGSVMGPHPFPTIVRDFQSVISMEIKEQILKKEGRLPDAVIACVGGGSNAIGAFYNFIDDKSVRLIGCEAAGRGVDTFETAATITTGKPGIFHGMKSYFCQDQYGQIAPVYSISAGLDYPGVGPEHSWLHDSKRAEYVAITDDEAVEAFEYLSRTEGIIPAIESAHAVAQAIKMAPKMSKDKIIVINISGRGDKDCAAIARYRGEDIYE